MRPDPGSDPLAASDHCGRKDLPLITKWCFCTNLQDVIDNILEQQCFKEITITQHCCCYRWIEVSGALNAPATSLWHPSHGASSPWRRALPHPIITCMAAKTPKRRKASNPLASALARWESEGGAPGPASEEPSRDKAVPLSEGEGRILQCLGAAVLLQWNDLPTPIQRQLFEHAVAMGEARHTAELKEQIARFLHTHKDDARASR